MSAKKGSARERLQEERRRQQEQERRRARLTRGAIVVAVLVGLTMVGVAVQATREDSGGPAALPDGVASQGGGVAFGAKDAPVTVDVYEDFQCPICRQVEAQMGSTIEELARDDRVRVVYHPLSFLGPESVRAANASGCASDAGEFLAFHRTLFENQPPEHSGGYTEDDLVAFGEEVGITSDAFESCVRDGRYEDWVSDVDREGRSAGVTGTPTLRVDGEDLPRGQYSPGGLRSAVESAQQQG